MIPKLPTQYANERYFCHVCDKQRAMEEVTRFWACTACGESVHIEAEDLETGIRASLLRKRVTDVAVGDMIQLSGPLKQGVHEVLGINQRGAALGLGLKGFGEMKLHRDSILNLRTGSW